MWVCEAVHNTDLASRSIAAPSIAAYQTGAGDISTNVHSSEHVASAAKSRTVTRLSPTIFGESEEPEAAAPSFGSTNCGILSTLHVVAVIQNRPVDNAGNI
jgi:hypothetical protein